MSPLQEALAGLDEILDSLPGSNSNDNLIGFTTHNEQEISIIYIRGDGNDFSVQLPSNVERFKAVLVSYGLLNVDEDIIFVKKPTEKLIEISTVEYEDLIPLEIYLIFKTSKEKGDGKAGGKASAKPGLMKTVDKSAKSKSAKSKSAKSKSTKHQESMMASLQSSLVEEE